MKTLEQILKQEPVYLGKWKEKIDMVCAFEDIYMKAEEYRAEKAPYPNVELWLERKSNVERAMKKYEEYNILFAYYDVDGYEGDAFVLYEKGGKLYEVNGSHCSCMGLEGQFDGEETTLEAIKKRITEGYFGVNYWDNSNKFAAELKSFIGLLEVKE